MAQNLTGAREESAYVLDLIGKKILSPPEQDKVIEDSVRYWTDYVNPGFLEYRKSVSTDYTAVEAQYGLPAGKGQTAYNLVVGARSAIDVSAVRQMIDWLG